MSARLSGEDMVHAVFCVSHLDAAVEDDGGNVAILIGRGDGLDRGQPSTLPLDVCQG